MSINDFASLLDFSEELGADRAKYPYLKLATPTTNEVMANTFVGGFPITAGYMLISNDPEMAAVGLEILPVAPPALTRIYRQQDADGLRKRICSSNDRVVPVHSGTEMYHNGLQKFIVTDKSMEPNSYVQTNNKLMVGGCSACPMSKFGNQLGLTENTPPACETTSVAIFYVHSGYLPKEGVSFGNVSPVAHYRENGYSPSMYDETSWDTYVVYTPSTYNANNILEKGWYKLPDNPKRIATAKLSDFLRPYLATRKIHNPDVAEMLALYRGMPEALLAFEFRGQRMNVMEVELLQDIGNELPQLKGLFTIGMKTATYQNSKQTMSVIPIFTAPNPTRSPILEFNSDELNAYLSARQSIVAADRSIINVLGWDSPRSTSREPAYLSDNTVLTLESGTPTEDDSYGIDSILDSI